MSHWYKPPGRQPLQAIKPEHLESMVGKEIHLAGEYQEKIYRLIEVRGSRILVYNGTTSLFAKAPDARYLRKNKPNNK